MYFKTMHHSWYLNTALRTYVIACDGVVVVVVVIRPHWAIGMEFLFVQRDCDVIYWSKWSKLSINKRKGGKERGERRERRERGERGREEGGRDSTARDLVLY